MSVDWLVVLSSDSHQNVQCTLCGFHLHYELFSMLHGKSINVQSWKLFFHFFICFSYTVGICNCTKRYYFKPIIYQRYFYYMYRIESYQHIPQLHSFLAQCLILFSKANSVGPSLTFSSNVDSFFAKSCL